MVLGLIQDIYSMHSTTTTTIKIITVAVEYSNEKDEDIFKFTTKCSFSMGQCQL